MIFRLFCSNHCFKASNFFKNQLETSPLWLRESETMKEVKLLVENNNKSSLIRGQEMDIGLNTRHTNEDADDQSNDDEDHVLESELPDEVMMNQDSVSDVRPDRREFKLKNNHESPMKSCFETAREAFKSWFTIDTFRYTDWSISSSTNL